MDLIKRASVYIFVFFVTTFLLFFFLWNRKNDLENVYLSQKTEKVDSEFRAILNGYDKLVFFFFESFITENDIPAIIYNASIDKKNISEYRYALYKKLEKTYNILKNYGISYLHFYFPDGTSFIRFHRLEKFGDKIKIKPFSAKKEKTVGGFRYVSPIFYKDILVGNAEIVVSFGNIRKDLNKLFKSEHKFLIRKEFVFNKLFIEERKNYVESDISPDFYYENTPDIKIIKRIPAEIISQINKKIRERSQIFFKRKKPFHFVVEIKGDFYTVSFIPIYAIKELKKEYLGYLVTYEKDNSIGIYKSSFWISFTTTSIIVFLLLIMAFSISYLKEKIFIEEAEQIDELTEAYNEKTFVSLLASELARAKRYDRAMSLMIIDFPSLKELKYDKKYEALKSIVGILIENIRETDYIAHIDDTQIAILAPETNLDEISSLAERIKNVLEHVYIENLGNLKFYISITEANFSDTVETLLKRVKEALYLAREKDKAIEIAI